MLYILSKSDIAMFFYVEYFFWNMLDICCTFRNWYVSRSYKFLHILRFVSGAHLWKLTDLNKTYTFVNIVY